MDLRFEELCCPNCGTKTMGSAGAHFGGRVDSVKMRCSECKLTLLIIPMRKDLEYEISATTVEERMEKEIKKAEVEGFAEIEKHKQIIKDRYADWKKRGIV